MFFLGTFSCSKNETATPTPTSIVDEPKYLEWNYEAGKDPLLIHIFTFANGIDPAEKFDISDTTKIENIFAGAVSGIDFYGRLHNLDMTKNSWNNQVFPNVPVKIGGHEFSTEYRDEIFKGVLLTNEKHLLSWSGNIFLKYYNEKLKLILDRKKEEYFKLHKKKPKYQVSLFVVPREYYESGPVGTIITMSDGNKIAVMLEPQRGKDELEKYLRVYGLIGHEFAGHGLTREKELFKDYIGQKDQFGNTVDVSGHVDSPAPRWVIASSTSYHIRNDNANGTLLFPQENKEYYSAYEGFEASNEEERKNNYAKLKLMKTPSEKSNIPYIADFVKNTRLEADKFMKDMWTDKILVPKGGRISTKEESVTIKSIISCH